MVFHLVVLKPFATYKRGDLITDTRDSRRDSCRAASEFRCAHCGKGGLSDADCTTGRD